MTIAGLDVKCQIRSISGFSAHADESELLDWIGKRFRPSRKFSVRSVTVAPRVNHFATREVILHV
jgi:predicted metal-dependent RNase